LLSSLGKVGKIGAREGTRRILKAKCEAGSWEKKQTFSWLGAPGKMEAQENEGQVEGAI